VQTCLAIGILDLELVTPTLGRIFFRLEVEKVSQNTDWIGTGQCFLDMWQWPYDLILTTEICHFTLLRLLRQTASSEDQ